MAEKKRSGRRETTLSSVQILREESSDPGYEKRALKDIVGGVQPVNYEDELIQRKREIQRDPLSSILLFPEDDIMAYKQPRQLRTEYSTVSPAAKNEASNLFVEECIKAYTCDWYIIENQYDAYAGSFHRLPKIRGAESDLQPQIFETDVEGDEIDASQDSMLTSSKEKGIFKEGYLTKSPFHAEGTPIYGSKTYKRRWFTLKQVSNDGSYVLEYKKDEQSVMAKGTLFLDSCTQITKGLKGRMHGFQLHIQDKVYGLSADSSSEMESWVLVLCKATGIDIEQQKPSKGLFGFKKNTSKPSNLRESLKNSNHPLLQEFAKENDLVNARRRQENRLSLFSTYPDLSNSYGVTEEEEEEVLPYPEKFGTRFLLVCNDLKFKMACPLENDSDILNCEPFKTTFALFDIKAGKKICEDFCCDLNDPRIKEYLCNDNGISNGRVSPSDEGKSKDNLIYPKQAIFSVTSPHSDVYLVVRISKVLQGGIGQCAEPYMKSYDNIKMPPKIQRQARLTCKRLGKYMMPFGWAVRSVFKQDGALDIDSEFSQIFKQESAKLTDEDMIKLLQDLKGDKSRQPVIPGSLSCKVSGHVPNFPNCYSPSYIPVKPFSPSSKAPPALEVHEFTSNKPEDTLPHTTYCNHFYVYPVSLNYANQKAFSKARNIACCVQFKDTDDLSARPLKSIYGRDGSCTMTSEIVTTVLYHNTTPSFFEEVKILLPANLHTRHHVLFTFYHVSVEQPKSETSVKKKVEIETPVGYAWMPVLENGIIRGDENNLNVTTFLPEGYLNCQPVGLGKYNGPELKWVDGKGASLFKVHSKVVSTVYTQDQHITNFFNHWQAALLKPSPDAETSRLLKLMHAVDVCTVIRFLPVILNLLFEVLVTSENEDVALNVVSVLVRVVSLVHEAGKGFLLKSYVKFILRIDESKKKTVHEELTRHLFFYLKPGADPVVISNILQHAWFFFEIVLKSMAQVHVSSNALSSDDLLFDNRGTRYPTEYHKSLENLLQVYISQLVNKYREYKPMIAKDANDSLALFLKRCFTHMDRGFVFQMINFVKDQFRSPDPQMFELKFGFLRVVSEHEHFVALNLPFDIRALGGVHESSINDVYCKKHFLVGLLLREVAAALNEGKLVRRYAIKLLRNMLVKHQFDDRYRSDPKQSRIAALYIPYLTTILEHSLRFHKNLDRPSIDDSLLSAHLTTSGRSSPAQIPSPHNSMSASGVIPQSSNLQNVPPTESSNKHIQPFEEDEKKELLLCFLYILKSLDPAITVDWWRDILTTAVKRPHWAPTAIYYVHQDKNFAKFFAVIDFFDITECCLNQFRYSGRKSVEEKWKTAEPTKSYLEQKYQTTPRPSPRLSSSSSSSSHYRTLSNGHVSPPMISEAEVQKRVLMETNLANEVAMIVLDVIELFCVHFKFHLEQGGGDDILMKKIFNVLMCFLRIGQSEYVLRHVFATLRSFIHKFPAALFKGSANLCGVLCFEILKLCNSKIERIRTQACCFMYLLMRSNYEYSGTGCVRVHLQVIVAVSKLIASGMNRASMNQSLMTIKNYSSAEDRGLKGTDFPSEVTDLVKKVHTVLQATAQMKEHEDDSEVLVDLQYSLAKSYSSTPELRQTWLQSMAEIHEKNGDFSEAAMCYIHAAALVAEYLKRKGIYPEGCAAFKNISPNVVPDESVMKDDEGTSEELRYSTKHLIDLLEASAERLKRAERYEVMGEVYKLAIPLYEEERNFRRLAVAYATLKDAYDKVVDVMSSGRRLLGRYYRVAFYGRAFKEDDGKEYLYKEPKLTSLPEIAERLSEKYTAKYGNIKIIQESSRVKPEELNPAVNYIQLTFVQPYFDEEELVKRPTDFERENNIRRFVFETPFTLSGKAHGALADQHKRKTILTTSHCFPYVKKRILVVQQEIYELTPLEVAIDEMQNKVKELNHVISLDPPDMKKLQLKLQGSVSVQVNAGPLAYANTFLDSAVVKDFPTKHVEALQSVYRDFIHYCGKALELNDVLIKPDQREYQDDLKAKYQSLKEQLAECVGEVNVDAIIPELGPRLASEV